jgi:hypothetical protein
VKAMKNSLNREVPSSFKPFVNSTINQNDFTIINEKSLSEKVEFLPTLNDVFNVLHLA